MIMEMLKTLSPTKIDEDQINGLKIMLQHESFKEFHPAIQQKLDEIEKIKKAEKEVIVGAFKMEAGKFYKTLNNSIVYCIGDAADERKIMRLVVIEGGYTDPDIPNNGLTLQIFGDMRHNGCYASDDLGRCLAAADTPKYPMHVVTKLEVQFKS